MRITAVGADDDVAPLVPEELREPAEVADGVADGAWMGYISGGYANARVDNGFLAPPNILFESTRTRHDGAYIGGGFDLGSRGPGFVLKSRFQWDWDLRRKP